MVHPSTIIEFDDWDEEADSPHRWHRVTFGQFVREFSIDEDWTRDVQAGLSDFGFWTLDGFSAPDMFVRIAMV